MRWIFRLALVAMVGMLFLPGNEYERGMVFKGFSSAFFKTLSYCDYNPDFCHRSKVALGRVTQSAKEGLSDLADAASETTGVNEQTFGVGSRDVRQSDGTLNGEDYEPGWGLQ